MEIMVGAMLAPIDSIVNRSQPVSTLCDALNDKRRVTRQARN